MILCVCSQLTEQEYRDFRKNPEQYFTDDDFMCRIECLGHSCESCLDRVLEIQQERPS